MPHSEPTGKSQIISSITSTTAEDTDIILLSQKGFTSTAMSKCGQSSTQEINGTERVGSESINSNALSKALKDMEDAGRARERTPGASPSRKRQRIYGDRLVRHIHGQLKLRLAIGTWISEERVVD